VLDEADEMLNVGFAKDIETILAAIPRDNKNNNNTNNNNNNDNKNNNNSNKNNSAQPSEQYPRQTLLFSATIPQWVKNISSKYLR